MNKKILTSVLCIVFALVCFFTVYYIKDTAPSHTLADIPEYSGEAYVVINGNTPQFSENELQTKSFENYSQLDSLGRCGVATASVGVDIMPTEDRGAIGSVRPSGWKTVKYDCVDGKYLYNRCHLIGFQLTGENANERNLITGTRYMNVQGMLPFENMVADYVKETGNHVLLRVTPIFKDNNLVASGVQMEAYSVEDNGDGVCFNVYCFNVQPGVEIDYLTGDSKLKEQSEQNPDSENSYILNTNSKKFHHTNCDSAKDISDKNRQDYKGSRNALVSQGYSPCKSCNP